MNNWESHIFWSAGEVSDILKTVICGDQRQVALILGEGFDPRMLDCLKLIVGEPNLLLKVFLLKLAGTKSIDQSGISRRVSDNRKELDSLIQGKGVTEVIDASYDDEDRNSTAPSASDKSAEFARSFELSEFTSVVVDISALPQGVYFPLLEILIGQRRAAFATNSTSLYIFVSENAELDSRIVAQELQEDAYMVPPFRSALSVSEDPRSIVWFPVLGERESDQISRVENLLPSSVEFEVCPILPMPSSNPRRADMLIREYDTILQDRWVIDSRSFIYSDERNPFHLYIQLIRAALRYREALSELGGCRAVISCHSSKLLSLGALLAASELNEIDANDFDIGLANVDAMNYSLDEADGTSTASSTFFLIPILGEVYAD